MSEFLQQLGKHAIIIDGGFGTMMQRAGMPAGECPESYNIFDPEMVAGIHSMYKAAGAHALTSNTFGGSRPKLAEHGLEDQLTEINRRGVKLARSLAPAYVFADVGPTGLVMEPLGDATFEEMFEIYKEQIEALASAGPDAIMLATMTDIAEVRCAVLASKAVCDLPVIASCSFGISGRMDLSGTDPATAAIILEAVGADVIGMNCGLGPEEMYPLFVQMASATSLPLVIQPNAGLPIITPQNETEFPGTADEMGQASRKFYEAGAALLGSCCGSTPAFTAAIYAEVANLPVKTHGPSARGIVVASPRRSVRVGGDTPIRVIGERINPTGKPELAESLRAESLSIVRKLASQQDEAGADLLDVNVGAAGVDAAKMLAVSAITLAGSTATPLVIDTTDTDAMEAALRTYPGRALLNSVSGEARSLDEVLPIAKTYGAAVVVLALDDEGIPATSEGRLAIIEEIRRRAHEAGLTDNDLIVDSLVMTAAADQDAPRVTLETLKRVKDLGLTTILGLSNVSHGLPERPLLNAAFVEAAAAAGLDAAIANPNDSVVMEAIQLANTAREQDAARLDFDTAFKNWENAFAHALAVAKGSALEQEDSAGDSRQSDEKVSATELLQQAIMRGDAESAPELVDRIIEEGMDPSQIIASVLTPAITLLGDKFGKGEVFLPQLMIAAEAMKASVGRVKEHQPESDLESADIGRVAFCTVKGDIHSIGKNICISMLESQGLVVDDLGVDVDPEVVIEAAAKADVVCLSALMTTTLPAMEDTVARIAKAYPDKIVFTGGAVVTRQWAESIGARYTKDAPECVEAVLDTIQKLRG